MKDLVLKLNEAERNLERAVDALNDAYRVSAPYRVTEGLSWGVTNCRMIRDRVRNEIDAMMPAETGLAAKAVR